MAKKSKTKEGLLDALQLLDELTLPKDAAKKIDSESNKPSAEIRKRELRIDTLFPALVAVNKSVEGVTAMPECGDGEFAIITPKQGAYLGGKYFYNTSAFGRKLDKPCTGAYRDKGNDFSEFEAQILKALGNEPRKWVDIDLQILAHLLGMGLMYKSVRGRFLEVYAMPMQAPYELMYKQRIEDFKRCLESNMRTYRHLSEENQHFFRRNLQREYVSLLRGMKRNIQSASTIIGILNNPKKW